MIWLIAIVFIAVCIFFLVAMWVSAGAVVDSIWDKRSGEKKQGKKSDPYDD